MVQKRKTTSRKASKVEKSKEKAESVEESVRPDESETPKAISKNLKEKANGGKKEETRKEETRKEETKEKETRTKRTAQKRALDSVKSTNESEESNLEVTNGRAHGSVKEGKQELEVEEEGIKNPSTKKRKVVEPKKGEDMKRRLRQVNWRDLDFVGLEVDAAEAIYNEQYSFPDLQRELDSGVLSSGPTPIYLFMGAQPVSDPNASTKPDEAIYNIPYIVAIQCRKEPSGRIAMASVQSAGEVIGNGRQFHYRYTPYYPKGSTDSVEVPIQICTLKYEGRKEWLKRLSKQKKHEISLLLPYELLPQIWEKKDLAKRLEEVRSVSFTFKAEDGRQMEVCWDRDCHHLAVDVEAFIEDEGWPESEIPRLKKALKAEFEKERLKVTEKYNKDEEELQRLSPEVLKSLREIKLYKFYPTHPKKNLAPFMSPVINRFYGSAHDMWPKGLDDTGSATNVNLPAAGGFNPNLVPESKITSKSIAILGNTAQEFSTSTFLVPAFMSAAQPTEGFKVDTIPATGFQFVSSDSTPSDSAPSDGGWRCPSCKKINIADVKTCADCWSSRL